MTVSEPELRLPCSSLHSYDVVKLNRVRSALIAFLALARVHPFS
jgi:hypothetical protein